MGISVDFEKNSLGLCRAANGGVQGAGGSVLIDSGATLSLSGSAVASSALLLADAGSLDLGTQAFNVFGDYSNTSFGNGNSFNARAGVSGVTGTSRPLRSTMSRGCE